MATKVEFKRVQTDAEVENIDIKDGQLIYTGTGKTYMDYGTERIPTGSGSIALDTEMSDTSENAVQNKVIKEYVDSQTVPEEVIVSDTQPTDNDNKLWIDTGEISSAASEITNEYSTSTGLGYSANYINNYLGNSDLVSIKSQTFTRSITQATGSDYWIMTTGNPLVIPDGYSVLGAIVTAVPNVQKMIATVTVSGSAVTMGIYNTGTSTTGTVECKVLFIKTV